MSLKKRISKAEDAPVKRRRAYLPAAQRRALIITAAQKVFSRSNLQGTRTRDIAKAAAVNQATIFEHFKSKEALFHASVVQPLIDAMRGMQGRIKLYESAASPDELAELARESTARHMQDMMEIFPLLTVALFSEAELGKKLYREQIAPLIRQRGTVIKSLVKDGIDPEFVGIATFGMLFAVAMDRYFGGKKDDVSALAKQFNRLSTSGFAQDKSKKSDKRLRGKKHGKAT